MIVWRDRERRERDHKNWDCGSLPFPKMREQSDREKEKREIET